MGLPVITKIENRSHFGTILEGNPGLVIIKFGAEWCGPCKQIENDVKHYFGVMPDNVQCISVDIDESFDIYAFLKSKKMVNGIPAILCYKQGNLNYVPDQFVMGAKKDQVKAFFDYCFDFAKSLQ